jgi:hypothetical protein
VSAALFSALVPGRVQAGTPPGLPNLAPIFPFRNGTYDNNFIVTNRLGGPTLEFEILTANIGGQDWVRPPITRTNTCVSSIQYFRMPRTHEYRIYWLNPDTGEYEQIDNRRKDTICIIDSIGNDPQNSCLRQLGGTFVCGCTSSRYGFGAGNGVTMGWADSYFRGLTGQWAFIGDHTGDFVLTVELDPDQLLQASTVRCLSDDDCTAPQLCSSDNFCLSPCQSDADCDDPLLCQANGLCNFRDRERDLTHDDNISYVYFHYEGGVGSVDPVQVVYTFAPVCTF